LTILSNDEVIALNQDKLGVQGHRVVSTATYEVWAGPLADGSIGVVLLNIGSSTIDISVQWSDIGIPAATAANVRDLWQHKDIGSFKGSYTGTAVATHASITLRITPASPITYNHKLMP